MGSYQTTTAISKILPGFLAGNSTTTDEFGTAFFSQKLDDAEARINGVIASRYSLPLSPVPPLLRTLAGDIAAYYAVRSGFTVDGLQRNQYLDDFKEAIQTLALIREGKMSLTYTDGSLVPVNTSGRFMSNTEGYTPVFQRDDPKNWDRDQDEIDDTENSRE